MSEELEWELFEMFETALFAFPIYDHKTARQIVHYLLRRGVLEEEIADAIEDSNIDLMIWLNRNGKHMVGEWVISWVNETRDEYLREMEIEQMHMEQLSRDVTPGRSIATSESGDTEDFEGSQSHIKRDDSEKRTEVGGDDAHVGVDDAGSGLGDADSGVQDSDDESVSPLLSPPRTLRRKWSKKGRDPPTPHPDPEIDESNGVVVDDVDDVVARHHSPTSDDPEEGATGSSTPSTFYGSIPSDIAIEVDEVVETEVITPITDHNQNQKCTNCTLANTDLFKVDKNGLPVKALCTCTLAHYSYITQLRQAEEKNEEYCDVYLSEMNDRALEINVDTLDKDGPGFIFIMTDSLRECMPWSAESRYKVASSRKPERCLLEFRSRNVDIDLIWQVKVEHHVMAVKEVHKSLNKYNLQSNWFRCSLSEIMEAISKVIKKYKHK